MTNEIDDEFLEAIRHRRLAHAESFDYDLKRITEDLQLEERGSGESVVHRPLRKPRVATKWSHWRPDQ